MGNVEKTLAGYRDAITVDRVFGKPFEKNGVTVIPAAAVLGGGGGGEGESPEATGGKGSGVGAGFAGRPAGAFVIRGDDVKWQPAIDLNRMVVGVLVYATLRLVLGRRRKR